MFYDFSKLAGNDINNFGWLADINWTAMEIGQKLVIGSPKMGIVSLIIGFKLSRYVSGLLLGKTQSAAITKERVSLVS